MSRTFVFKIPEGQPPEVTVEHLVESVTAIAETSRRRIRALALLTIVGAVFLVFYILLV